MFLKDKVGKVWIWAGPEVGLHPFIMLSMDGVWIGDGKQQGLLPITSVDEYRFLRSELDALLKGKEGGDETPVGQSG